MQREGGKKALWIITVVAAMLVVGATAYSAGAVGWLAPRTSLAFAHDGGGVDKAGETIAYVDDESVYIVWPKSLQRRLLIEGEISPAWSPDGAHIAAVDQLVYIHDANGKSTKGFNGNTKGFFVKDSNGVCDEPAWSPNGRQIACVGPTDDRLSNVSEKPGLYLEDVKTGDEKRLPVTVGWDPSPTWSPDGKQLAYSDRIGVIRILDLNTHRTRTLGRGRSPDWSPKGDAIAYSTGASIVVSRPDGAQRHTVVSSKGTLDQPAWSSDGTRIVYAAFGKTHESLGLRLISAGGGQVRAVTQSGYDPAWKPG